MLASNSLSEEAMEGLFHHKDRHGVQEAGKPIKNEQEMERGDWQTDLSWEATLTGNTKGVRFT